MKQPAYATNRATMVQNAIDGFRTRLAVGWSIVWISPDGGLSHTPPCHTDVDERTSGLPRFLIKPPYPAVPTHVNQKPESPRSRARRFYDQKFAGPGLDSKREPDLDLMMTQFRDRRRRHQRAAAD